MNIKSYEYEQANILVTLFAYKVVANNKKYIL